jgi:hypothetical protein
MDHNDFLLAMTDSIVRKAARQQGFSARHMGLFRDE